MRTILSLFMLLVLFLTLGCANSNHGRVDSIVGTPFENGGITNDVIKLLNQRKAQKGGEDKALDDNLNAKLQSLFDRVIGQCKDAISSNQNELRDAQNWVLTVSIIGLLSGVGASALAAKANASRSTIAALSGTAGAANSLQNQLREGGKDPVEYLQRSKVVRDAIAEKLKSFQDTSSEIDDKVRALNDLTAICVANS